MNISDLQTEFSNVVTDDNHANFGFTVNSVGYKTILAYPNKSQTDQIKDFKFHFKKGRVSNEFKIIYITKGSGFVRFEESEQFKIGKGMMLMIMPNQKYQYYHHTETEWKEYFVRFEANQVYALLIKSLFTENEQIVDVGFNEELVKLFQRSIDVVRNGLKSSQVYLSGILLHILGLTISESKNKAIEKKEMQIIEQAKIIMNENIFTDIDAQSIASMLNVSYSTFRMNFKKHTGLSPAKYINDLRLNKAKEMLTETSNSIKEISYLLQFSSSNHFSSIFKKASGVSPKDYRSMNSDIEID